MSYDNLNTQGIEPRKMVSDKDLANLIKPQSETLTLGAFKNSNASSFSDNNNLDAAQLKAQINDKQSGFSSFASANKFYIIAGLIGVLIIGTLGFLAFRPQKPAPTTPALVQLSISSEPIVRSGGELIYTVGIKNNDAQKLVGISLELIYPEGVKYVSSAPPSESLSGEKFTIPDLSPGQNTVMKIKSTVSGNVNDEKSLTAKLRYKFANFSSEFIAEQKSIVRITASDVVLEVTGADTSLNSDVNTYEIIYRNNSTKEIDNASIKVLYPQGFQFADAKPKATTSNNSWNLGTLKPQGNGKIVFQGSFAGSKPGQGGEFIIDFVVTDSSGNRYTQASITHRTIIQDKPLVVSQELPALISNNNNVVKPGDTITYTIKFQNNNATVARDIQLVAELDSKAIDLESLKAEGGKIENATITWNGSSSAKLAQLNPSESGSVQYSVKVNDPAAEDGSTNLTVLSRIKIKSGDLKTFLSGNDALVKISSPSSMAGSVSFVEGGLPPKVGQVSYFTVKLELKNASNAYDNGQVTAVIPAGVELLPETVSGKENAYVKYNKNTGAFSWNVGELAANSGSSEPARSVSFDVKFNPAASQFGKNVELIKSIVFNAKDSFTGQAIKLTAQNIHSDQLPGQPGMGRVIK